MSTIAPKIAPMPALSSFSLGDDDSNGEYREFPRAHQRDPRKSCVGPYHRHRAERASKAHNLRARRQKPRHQRCARRVEIAGRADERRLLLTGR